MTGTRDLIIAALATVDHVNAGEAQPDIVAPGAAWPVWVSAAAATYCGLQDTWFVYVVLPNATMRQTVEAADPFVDAVWAALLDVGEVTSADAVVFQQGDPAAAGAPIPGLRFTLTTVGKKS